MTADVRVQATHNEQHFQGVQDPALRASLPVGERSILGSLLPESLLYQLEAYGARAFAEQMTRHMDDPEVLWSQAMREEELLPAVHAHLAAFPLRLRDNVLGLYDYTPMPPMTYKALKGELWCFRYYLRKLCSPEHLSHSLVDPVRFRNEIVAEWNKEMDRKAADFTQSDALDAMAIQPEDVDGIDAESMLTLLKKAYRKQALKLHPDKNPDGPEPFLKMQRAYQALIAEAQGEAEIGGGPRPQRLTLLLRAQCLLHRREPDTLGEYTYPAYDPLLALLHSAVAESLSGEHVMLCLELMWLTLNACPGNAPFLGDKGAVPVLVHLLMSARKEMAEDTAAHVDHAVIVTLSLRALALVLSSEEARKEVICMGDDERREFLKVLCWCASLPKATNVAAAALGALTACAAAAPLQAQLMEMAVLATVFTRMLQFNATEGVQGEIDIVDLRGGATLGDASTRSVSAKQKAAHEVIAAPASDNLIAIKATAALAALCGLAEGNEALPDVQASLVQTAVRALLTPFLYARVQKPEDHIELLKILTTERSNPLVVWTPSMRRQLRSVIDKHARAAPITHDALRTLGEFKYDEVAEELVIEDVYVRLFCEDPAFAGMQHKTLSLFSGLAVHLHMAICSDTSSLEKSLRPSGHCAFETPPGPGDNPAARTIPHLYIAFEAAHALVVSPTYSAALHSALATTAVLAPLVCWIMKPCIDADRDAAAVGDAFSLERVPEATALTHTCAETSLKIIEAGSRIPEVKGELCGSGEPVSTSQICKSITHTLFCTLHSPCTRSAQRSALLVLATLLDTTEPTRVAVEDGGFVLLLDIIFSCAPAGMTSAELAEDTEMRALTVKALCTLLEHKSALQVRIERTILQLVPEAMLEKIRSSPEGKEVIERAIDVPVDTPELVWTADMHERTCDKLGTLASDVRACMVSGTSWKLQPSDTIMHEELQYDLFVGGVYLRRFLDTGKSSSSADLSDPRAFLDGVMLELNACTDSALEAAMRPHAAADTPEGTASNHDLALMLGRAAELALGRYPSLPTHATQQGYVEWLVARSPKFGALEDLQNVGGVLLRVLLQLSLNPISAQRLAAPNPALVPWAQACTPWNLAAAVFTLDIVRCALHDTNPDRDEVIHQAVVHGFVLQLLGLLEPEVEGLSTDLVPPHYVAKASVAANSAAKADSDVVRNLAVEIMHKLVKSDAYGEQIGEILADFQSVWRKHQRHSGMILTDTSATRAAPAANLLRGPTSTTQFALPPPATKEVLLIKSTAAVREEAEEAKRATMSSLSSPTAAAAATPAAASAVAARAAAPAVAAPAAAASTQNSAPPTPSTATQNTSAAPFDPFGDSAAAPLPPKTTAAAAPSLSSILTSQSQTKAKPTGPADPLAGSPAAAAPFDPFAASSMVMSPMSGGVGVPVGESTVGAGGTPTPPTPQDPFATDPFAASMHAAPPTTNGQKNNPAAPETADPDYDPLA